VLGAVMALCFAYQFTVLLPKAGIGWQAHLGGFVGGLLAGWIFRDKRGRDSPRKPLLSRPAPGASALSREELLRQIDDLTS
jgi:membrane associated rhomboid family serine protease